MAMAAKRAHDRNKSARTVIAVMLVSVLLSYGPTYFWMDVPYDVTSMATGAPPASKVSQAQPLPRQRPTGSAMLGMPLPAGGSLNPAPPREEIAGRIPGDSVSNLSGSSAISYREALLAHIARYRRYPADARRDHVEGIVEVRFVLDRAGAVENVWIAASSGRTNLDAEALAAIRRAVPMPKIPSDLPDSLDITLPIDFQIG